MRIIIQRYFCGLDLNSQIPWGKVMSGKTFLFDKALTQTKFCIIWIKDPLVWDCSLFNVQCPMCRHQLDFQYKVYIQAVCESSDGKDRSRLTVNVFYSKPFNHPVFSPQSTYNSWKEIHISDIRNQIQTICSFFFF